MSKCHTKIERVDRELGAPFAQSTFESAKELVEMCKEATKQEDRFRAHPLGFAWTKFHRCDGVSIRVHVWHRSFRDRDVSQQSIHTHRWRLRGIVVAGRIQNHIYRITEESTLGKGRLCIVRYSGQTSELEEVKSGVDVAEISSQDLPAGAMYSVEPEVFHETRVVENVGAITVVREEQIDGIHAQVIVFDPMSGPGAFDRAYIDTQRVIEAMNEIQGER